jgi:prepilin-type processing-associated H-X9-DG protein
MGNWHLPNSYQASLERTYSDGTSNTLCVAESYGRCRQLNSSTGTIDERGTLWAHETVTPEWHAMFNDWNARGAASKFQVMPSNLKGECNWFLPQQIHSGGMNILMLDGSVRTVNSSVSNLTWAIALTPSGGETLPGDW